MKSALFFQFILSHWLIANDLPLDFENLKEDVLAVYLRRFYAEVRTKDGRQYSKKSMLAIRSALFRYLTQPLNNVTFNILTDTEFIAANNVLTGVCRKLKATGQDLSKHHLPIKKDDLAIMYVSEVLSDKDPVALQRKVFFETVLHFGRRGREGLRQMKKSDIIFTLDENGKEYATLAGNPLEKNHQGFSSREGEHIQIMYGTGEANCPLGSLKFYLTKLNEMCEALFQRPRDVKLGIISLVVCQQSVRGKSSWEYDASYLKRCSVVHDLYISLYLCDHSPDFASGRYFSN